MTYVSACAIRPFTKKQETETMSFNDLVFKLTQSGMTEGEAIKAVIAAIHAANKK